MLKELGELKKLEELSFRNNHLVSVPEALKFFLEA
jgi:Leucine-rich repeat (LRR) protein